MTVRTILGHPEQPRVPVCASTGTFNATHVDIRFATPPDSTTGVATTRGWISLDR